MAWHLIVAVANPVASFGTDRRPIAAADPRPERGFVPRFKLLPSWTGSSSLFDLWILLTVSAAPSTASFNGHTTNIFRPPWSQILICKIKEDDTMAARSTILVLLTTAVVAVSSAGFLESLLSWELPNAVGRRSSMPPQSQCLCQTFNCLCCVDLNLTATIDLGGAACINVKQKEQNVSLNLSYGDNPVHNATIKIADAANKPTCMNLLSDLAQICAKFTSVQRTDAGYDGCLVIEPSLLGTPQVTYHMGCFNFNQVVRQIQVSAITETTEATESTEEDEETLNTEELIAAVTASAEQGIALFSQWLGLNLNPKLNLTSNNDNRIIDQRVVVSTTSRSARTHWDQEEKNEERFKQLLSAQDNVLKGSATIGRSIGAETTFVYSKPTELLSEKNSVERDLDEVKIANPRHLVMVPRESRRGGRAYNIHQHVNEI
ncbi:uncharacterized protein LOC128873714 [Hylaeus volcanicus]|uniref:uncharacterized protein LOC128873714 n=1 Tax=Hylaeus volcanicus TaxID=313075 RepID=UPI0023B7CBE8|nr:uncharacterized protein LOC128873714 [Hylaeus volcanicus]XP_053973451.1 uncharacterized protein LOC128873714 [Hylaeus volcanicus]XP_053973452.1 uncharacterized protein LOC128873714 [Hylaeus volcanicus]XP_053973453.1 uncharacterized protein LOC128873714 [Hylaeus volcanicus]